MNSALATFLLAMVTNSSVQQKAQHEIDNVIGRDRLPTLDDRTYLPYVEAISREVYRWNLVVPLCMPRKSTEDDEYQGYFIPAGKPPSDA